MSEDIRKMIDKVKNFKQFVNEDIQNHSERYNFLIKKYNYYKEKDSTIDTKFKKEVNGVLLFDISDFMIKFNFNTTKDYRNIVKQTHDFVFDFIKNNQNKLFVGELFPSSTYVANDCNTFNVKNIQLKVNRLYGDVIFVDNELGRLSYYIIKNKLMNAKFQIMGEFEGFTNLVNINGFMIK